MEAPPINKKRRAAVQASFRATFIRLSTERLRANPATHDLSDETRRATLDRLIDTAMNEPYSDIFVGFVAKQNLHLQSILDAYHATKAESNTPEDVAVLKGMYADVFGPAEAKLKEERAGDLRLAKVSLGIAYGLVQRGLDDLAPEFADLYSVDARNAVVDALFAEYS